MKNIRNIRSLLRLQWKYNRKYFYLTAIALFLPSIGNIALVILPKVIIENLQINNYNMAFTFGVIMSLIILLVNMALDIIDYQKYKSSGEFEITLNKLLIETVSSENYQNFEEFSYREQYHYASLCVKEGSIDRVIDSVTILVSSLISLVSLMYISSVIVWWIWIIIAISVIINVLCEIYRVKYDHKSYKKYSAIDMRMLYARDTLSWKDFAKEVRLFNMYDYVTQTATHYINLLSDLQKKRSGKTFQVYVASSFFDFLQRIAVYGYIAFKCFDGTILIADFSMLVLAILTISRLGSDIAKSFVQIGAAGLYVSAYTGFIDNGKYKVDKELDKAKHKEDLNFAFKDVSFNYPGSNTLALENISYNFHANKKYGLVGSNGSGKTTFINLLIGLYNPTSGEISYNNKDISSFSKESYFKLFSTVFQDFNMLAYTVSDNITMFSKSKDSTKEALEKAGMKDTEVEQYYSSEYERGIELSGGETQKLAIARAIYKNAPVFIFDEPTAALSPKSEYELYENISNEMKDKTIFFISHRLASCRMCDEILVFDEGEIIESGSHDELMGKKGMYFEMFMAQAELYDDKQREEN